MILRVRREPFPMPPGEFGKGNRILPGELANLPGNRKPRFGWECKDRHSKFPGAHVAGIFVGVGGY
jgi:hypothetical protein